MSESVSQWLPRMRAGDERATQHLWQRYFRRLMSLARRQLGAAPRAVSDEEDIAIQALSSFFRRAQNGSFRVLNNRDDLWRVLACIARRKAANEHRQRRTSRRRRAESREPAHDVDVASMEEVWYLDFETPEALVALHETRERMLAALTDDELRAIAEAKLDGYTNLEIAGRIRRSVPTIERRVRLIRQLWEQLGITAP